MLPQPQLVSGVIAMVCLNKVNNYTKKVKSFRIGVMLLGESGLEDIVLTINSISKYGIEYEGNPILKMSMEHLGTLPGLLIPKILALGVTIYTAYMMNKKNYRIKGEYLLYGASFCWLYGAISHFFLE